VFVSPEGWTAAKDFKHWLTAALEFNPRAQSSKQKSPKKTSRVGTAARGRRD
jgi:hypothetical protein